MSVYAGYHSVYSKQPTGVDELVTIKIAGRNMHEVYIHLLLRLSSFCYLRNIKNSDGTLVQVRIDLRMHLSFINDCNMQKIVFPYNLQHVCKLDTLR